MKFIVNLTGEDWTEENPMPQNELHVEFDGNSENIVGALVGAMVTQPELKRLMTIAVCQLQIFEAEQAPVSDVHDSGTVKPTVSPIKN